MAEENHKRPTWKVEGKTSNPKKTWKYHDNGKYESEVDKLIKKIESLESVYSDMISTNDSDDNLKIKADLVTEIEKTKLELEREQHKEITAFYNNTRNTIKGNVDNFGKIFGTAKKDAETRLLQAVCLSKEELEECFQDKAIHSWVHDLRHKPNNVIPLSPGIKVPIKKNPDGSENKIYFTISKFYEDSFFISKCKDYYTQFGIEFQISQDAKIKNKWYIKLIDNDQIIDENTELSSVSDSKIDDNKSE